MTALRPDLVVYYGRSMHPTLREPEMMEVTPYGDRPICRGDVILFPAPGRSDPIVHRVVAVLPGGLQTRGDNAHVPDDWLIPPDQVTGQVRAAVQGSHRRPLAQGWRGFWVARLRQALLPASSRLAGWLHTPYHFLARGEWLRRLLPARWRPCRVAFYSEGRQVQRIMLWNRVIGEYDPQRKAWHIQRPFRLLIDPQDLEMGP
jgi:hypothetical protein